MVRKLEKIEKEMGYCEIKLEKERRLRRQVEFLMADLEVLGRFVKEYEGSDTGLSQLPFDKIGRQIRLERQRHDRPGQYFQRSKEDFITAGVLEMAREERGILLREKEDIEAKFGSFSGFSRKRNVLEEEKQEALDGIESGNSSRLRRLIEEFKKTERQWNSLTEDALNIEESLRYLDRHADYVRSARNFLIAAKGSFDIENWVDNEHAGNLFRHSNIGRSKEMIDGANRNLKLAQKELACVVHVKVEIERFQPILITFLDALFDDIFRDGRLDRTLEVVEAGLAESTKHIAHTRHRREQLHRKLTTTERTRINLFQRLGGENRGRVAVR